MPVGRLRKIAIAGVALVLVVLAAGAWFFRVDDIPDELPPVLGDPSSIVIPALGGVPELRVADLAGKTSFFVVYGPQIGKSKEGQSLSRALNRWVLPPGTVGHIVGDAEGFGMFKAKAEGMMEHFAGETRFPVYVDFEGVFSSTFGLAKGHHGFVVIGPDGAVLERRSGGAEGQDLERIRVMLGAEEPPAGPPMPEFTVGDLSSETCGHGTPCAIIFLGREVARTDVPGIDDGFDGDEEEGIQRMKDPSIRMVSTAAAAKLSRAKGAIVGRTQQLEFPTWQLLEAAPEARAAFGLDATEAAFVVIDAEGRLPVVARGAIPLYQWGRVADTLGVELDEDDD